MAVTIQGDMIISTNTREDREAMKEACAPKVEEVEATVEEVVEVEPAPKKVATKAKAEVKE